MHEKVLLDLRENPGGSKAECERVCKFYQECQQQISNALAARHQSYDLPIIYLANIGLIMVFFTLIHCGFI